MNIYLDIDGVLLANENYLALSAEAFISFVVNTYPTFWLTTHCMDGDPSLAIENVGRLSTPETINLLQKIKPTAWKTAKTEAIDFNEPFLWFDDDLFDDEKVELMRHNTLDSWKKVDLSSDPRTLTYYLENFPSSQD